MLEEALVAWILQKQQQKLSISREIIQAKGRQFAEELGLGDSFKFSNRWLESFCKRNAFRSFRQHGESGATNINTIEIQQAIAEIKEEIKKYAPADVYNMDESALFYNMSPDTTIARQQIEDAKKDKIRMTIAFTCNSTGIDRFCPLYIGHAAKTRCFKKKSGEELGFFYCRFVDSANLRRS